MWTDCIINDTAGDCKYFIVFMRFQGYNSPFIDCARQRRQQGDGTVEEKIREKIEELRGMLQADGGDMELVGIEGTNVKLKLKGACGGCPHAGITIRDGIQRILRESIDESITVERVG